MPRATVRSVLSQLWACLGPNPAKIINSNKKTMKATLKHDMIAKYEIVIRHTLNNSKTENQINMKCDLIKRDKIKTKQK